MKRLIFFLEEPSAKAMLETFLPRILPNHITYRYHVFAGKDDLDKKLAHRLRGYQSDGIDSKFIVLRDQDLADCKVVKDKLVKISTEANKPTLVRIACRELESWYLADLEAVGTAFSIPQLKEMQKKSKFSSPDSVAYPSKELKKLTNGRYQKIDGSRLIGEYLNAQNQRSSSFKHFVKGIMHTAGIS